MLAFASPTPDATPIWLVSAETWPTIKSTIGVAATAFAERCGFQPKAGRLQLLPGEAARSRASCSGLTKRTRRRAIRSRPASSRRRCPKASTGSPTRLETPISPRSAFCSRSTATTASRPSTAPTPRLVAPDEVDAIRIQRIAEAIAFGRDLVNAPANVLGPDALEQEAVKLAEHFDASVTMVRGDELVAANFPLVHAVGRAGAEEPRLVDFSWGREDAPKVAIVGKGVTFDTGGLDIKPASGMELMKKDMGGAATALTLARMIMEAGLDLRLRTLIPIVENAISAPAMRPGDVIVSRKGISVEVGNTDAEGRMILADALALADEDAPELMFDFATLTGAARVALGPDLPPFYTDDDALAAPIADHAARVRDPLWRMPLWRPYDAMIEGSVADISNSGTGAGMAGSITAALFLRRFVEKAKVLGAFRRLRLEPEAARPWARGRRDPGGAGAVRAVVRALSEAVRRASSSPQQPRQQHRDHRRRDDGVEPHGEASEHARDWIDRERPRRADAMRGEADGEAARGVVGDAERVHQRGHDDRAEDAGGDDENGGQRRRAAERLGHRHRDARRDRLRRERDQDRARRAEPLGDQHRRGDRHDAPTRSAAATARHSV